MPIFLDKDHETGGIGIQDPNLGLFVQPWSTRVSENGTQIIVSAPNTPDTLLYTGTNITEVSLTFDQLMNPTYCFVEDGSTKLRWFDTSLGQMVTTDYGTTYISPKVSLDDKFDNTGINDVIFAYIRDNILYYRLQRDRYLTEYQVSSSPVRRIQKIGMTAGYRFQFLCLV